MTSARSIAARVLLAAVALWAAWAGASAVARAQAATVTMEADRTTVEVGGVFRVNVVAQMSGRGSVSVPESPEFDVVGRRVRMPVVIQTWNGRQQQMQATETHELTLRARRAGTFVLPVATCTLGGQTYRSPPLTITVGAGGAPAPTAGAQRTVGGIPPMTAQELASVYRAEGFLRTIVHNDAPYPGQQVTVTVVLYVPGGLRGQPQFTQEPTTAGFWVHDLLEPNRALRGATVQEQNQRFTAYELRRFAAFPLRTGTLTIGAPIIQVRDNSIFGAFNLRPSQNQDYYGQPVTVEVRELPSEGRPDGPVHVGRLTLTASLDDTQVPTGTAVTLTLEARGTGALQQLPMSTLEVDGLRVLQPEVVNEVNSPADLVGGRRTVRWLVVPEREGTFRIPPFEIETYDAGAAEYRTAQSAPLTLTAAGAVPGLGPSPDAADEPADDANASALELRPIHPTSALSRSHSTWESAPEFLSLFAIGPLLFLGALFVRSARRRAATERPGDASKRARKSAKKRLSTAEAHVDKEEPRLFYAAIASALKEVLEARVGQAVGSLTHPELSTLLAERGMAEALRTQLVEELEGCDFARFSAVGVSRVEMSKCLTRTRELLVSLDRFVPTEEDAS